MECNANRLSNLQSDAEVYLTGVVPLGAVKHKFNFRMF